MKSRTLTVVAMFLASILVGYNMFPSIQSVQAAPQLNPLVVELPQLNLPSIKDPQPEPTVIDVEYNLETQELTVHGNADAQVNFRTVGEIKPIVKWKTKIKEVEVPVNTGYPFIKGMTKVTEKLPSLSEMIGNHGEE